MGSSNLTDVIEDHRRSIILTAAQVFFWWEMLEIQGMFELSPSAESLFKFILTSTTKSLESRHV